MTKESQSNWKTMPIDKINLKSKALIPVEERIFEFEGKQYSVLIHNGSFYIHTDTGNIQTALEQRLNSQ